MFRRTKGQGQCLGSQLPLECSLLSSQGCDLAGQVCVPGSMLLLQLLHLLLEALDYGLSIPGLQTDTRASPRLASLITSWSADK
jgi:hypothetical protein